MADEKKVAFDFSIVYFKPSGKFYTEAKYRHVVRTAGPTKTPYMHDVVAHIRGRQNAYLTDETPEYSFYEPMPGLSGVWTGPILVNHPDGFPCLILPKVKDE